MKRDKMILLVSGGIDSYIAWKYLNKPYTLFIDYGQPYINIEEKAVDILYPNTHKVKLQNLPSLNNNKIFIPARNIMLASIAIRFSSIIALGGVKDEICKDKSPLAFKKMSLILTEFNDNTVTVFSPIWHFTKSEAVKYHLDMYGEDGLRDTISCYSASRCNNCESCFRRSIALASNGIIEKDRIPTNKIIKQFINNIHIQPRLRLLDIVIGLRNFGFTINIVDAKDYKPNNEYTIVLGKTDVPLDDMSGNITNYESMQILSPVS